MTLKVWDQATFRQMLAIQLRRAHRCREPFVLMLLDMRAPQVKAARRQALSRAIPVLASATRETDVIGWKEHSSILGIIFTEVGWRRRNAVADTLRNKVETSLRNGLGVEFLKMIALSLSILPEDCSNWGATELQPAHVAQPHQPVEQYRPPNIHAERRAPHVALPRRVPAAQKTADTSPALLVVSSEDY